MRKVVSVPLTVYACTDFSTYRTKTGCDSSLVSLIEWLLILYGDSVYSRENQGQHFPHLEFTSAPIQVTSSSSAASVSSGSSVPVVVTPFVSMTMKDKSIKVAILEDAMSFPKPALEADGEVDVPTLQSAAAAHKENTIKLMFVELLASYQTKLMKMENLKSYYAQKNMRQPSERVNSAFMQFASNFNDTRASRYFSTFRAENKFVAYHTTAVSSPQFVISFYDGLPQAVKLRFKASDVDAWRNAINQASNARAADACNKEILLHAYCYSISAKLKPENFFQAIKLYDSTNAGKRKAIQLFYTNLQKLASNEEAMTDAKSIDDLLKASEGIWF